MENEQQSQRAPREITLELQVDAITRPEYNGGQYFFRHPKVPEDAKGWIGIDRTGAETKAEAFDTIEDVMKFFGRPVEAGRPIPPPSDRAEAVQTENAAPTSSEVVTDALGLTEDEMDSIERPFQNLSDDELRNRIDAARDDFYHQKRKFMTSESRIMTLLAELERANLDLFTAKKEAAEGMKEKGSKVKEIALEYFLRNRLEKKYDPYVTSKEFVTYRFDEVPLWEWVREKFPVAIIPAVSERLDFGQIEDYAKSRVKAKEALPPGVTQKKEIRVEISNKVPEAEVVTLQPEPPPTITAVPPTAAGAFGAGSDVPF